MIIFYKRNLYKKRRRQLCVAIKTRSVLPSRLSAEIADVIARLQARKKRQREG
jgi:hypothetical protein